MVRTLSAGKGKKSRRGGLWTNPVEKAGVISLAWRTDGAVTVELDCGSVTVEGEQVEALRLKAGEPVEGTPLARLLAGGLEWAVRQTALGLLGRREHTRLELTHKLRARYGKEAPVAPCLARLEAEGLLNEERFARMLIRERMERSLRGPLLVCQELISRGVGEEAARRLVADPAWDAGWDEAAAARLAQEARRLEARQQETRQQETRQQETRQQETRQQETRQPDAQQQEAPPRRRALLRDKLYRQGFLPGQIDNALQGDENREETEEP
ncbi:MAG: recombination regulator RecX [Deltaproteobacteria bacterium]|nr:recombination regulator RecX [Deltaproteobacteria bacterium]